MPLTRLRSNNFSDSDYKASCRVVTTTNITLSGGAPTVVDGVTLVKGDRVLVAGQSTASQNGIYKVTTLGTGSNGTWARDVDANTNNSITAGTLVFIEAGTAYANEFFYQTATGNITIGTSSLNFATLGNAIANIINGNSNVNVTANSNITISVAGTANVLTVTSTGANIAGTANVTGNANVGNLGTATAIITTGNITTINSGLMQNGNSNVTITANSNVTINANGSARMTITAAGNVGIGTTSPSTTLQVLRSDLQTGYAEVATIIQQVSAGNTSILGFGQVADNQSFIEARDESNNKGALLLQPYGGNVGIGASSPGHKLQVTGGYIAQQQLDGTLARISLINTNRNWSLSNYGSAFAPNGTFHIADETAGLVRFSIGTDGNVGIGIASPTSTLHVVGTANISGNANIGNLGTATAIATTGNITTINSGLLQNGNSNVTITANGNVTVNAVGGTRFTATSTGANVTGTLGVSGNANVGNLGASGNITAAFFLGNGSQLTGITASAGSAITNGNSNVSVVANSNVTVSVTGTANVLTVTSTGANITGTANISGNANTGNLGTTTLVATTGNITTINSGLLQNGNSNVTITANGNVSVNAVGGQRLVLTSTGANITGTANISSTFTARNANYTFTLPNVGAASSWIRLGTFAAPQTGSHVYIKVVTSVGYNADPAQQSEIYIHFKTSNGGTVDANGFAGEATFYIANANGNLYNVKVVGNAAGVSATAYDIFFFQAGAYNGDASFYTVELGNQYTCTWTNSSTTAADPGVASSTIAVASNRFLLQSNLGIGVTAATSTLHVAGTANITGNANTGNLGTGTVIATAGNITTINSGLRQNGNSNVSITANGNINFAVTGSNRYTMATTSFAPTGNATQQLGLTGARWSNIWGLASSAQYADLAERYQADNDYSPGTVVVFGGVAEITVTHTTHDTRVAGVISTAPGYLMNDYADQNALMLPVALTGRVPTKVKGPVEKGDIIVTSDELGVAMKLDQYLYKPGCIIGKSLEDHNTTDIKTIEVVIGRF